MDKMKLKAIKALLETLDEDDDDETSDAMVLIRSILAAGEKR